MIGEYGTRAAERAWKHRFAQTLYEVFCAAGMDGATALADAYAHADVQFLVRGLATPEAAAQLTLTSIQFGAPQAASYRIGEGKHTADPHNGAHQRGPSQSLFLCPDLSE